MKETICTIPVNDIFGPKKGCPICRLHDMLETQYVNFITGDAMMEPSIRVETNRKGFCRRHLLKMISSGRRLPNALMLETHLEELLNSYVPEKTKSKPDKKQIEAIERINSTCYVCERIERDVQHILETVFAEWSKGGEFRKLYNEQEFICMEHYPLVLRAASARGGVPSKLMPDFYKETAALTRKYLEALKTDVSYFCTMFDYRSQGKDWGTSVDALERTVEFLTPDV